MTIFGIVFWNGMRFFLKAPFVLNIPTSKRSPDISKLSGFTGLSRWYVLSTYFKLGKLDIELFKLFHSQEKDAFIVKGIFKKIPSTRLKTIMATYENEVVDI